LKVIIRKDLGVYEENVIELLFKAFEGLGSREHFSSFIKDVPNKFFIIVTHNQDVVGVLCLLERSIHILNIEIPVVWMSYMAIDSKFKTFQITNILKKEFFKFSSEKILSIGVARKAMDGYWYPYAFVGLTNFSNICLSTKVIPRTTDNYTFKKINDFENYLDLLERYYQACYKVVNGSVKRDKEIWLYYSKKIRSNGLQLYKVSSKEKVIGFFLFKGNSIFELFGTEEFLKFAPSIINNFFIDSGLHNQELNFDIGQSHIAFDVIKNYNYSISKRYVWNGGHIVRVESEYKLLKYLLPSIEKKILSLNIKNFDIDFGYCKLVFDGKKLSTYKYKNCLNEISKFSMTKIIFGLAGNNDFYGINKNSIPILKLIFEDLNFQIPFLDQM